MLFSSCLEIIEELNVREDGSGDITLTINLSQSSTKVKSVMLLDSIAGYKTPTKAMVVDGLKKVENYLNTTPGISKVTTTQDFEHYIFSVGCSFTKLTQVKKLLQEVLKVKKRSLVTDISYDFNTTNRVFKRHFPLDKKLHTSFYNLPLSDKQKTLEGALYTHVFRFERSIASCSVAKAKIAPSKKALLLQVPLQDIVSTNYNTDLIIELVP